MFWVISYDIPDNKRRRKVADLLEGYGRRAQYSVFECEISEEQQAVLERRMRKLIDEAEDDVRFYPMNRADLKRVVLLGNATLERVRGHYLT
jgi:CRISPR-associated protein Cas2